VKTAFLNGELEEDIYMDQPQGFVQDGKEHLVCKLKKSLYGLKQSPRAWYQRIDMFFTHEDFSRSQADHSLYVKQTGEYLLIVIIYVDDLIILASNVSILKWLKSRLEDEFDMSDLGELHYCLGVEFKRDRVNRTITMSQSKYIEEVLKRFNMEECKPIGTLLDVNSKLLKLTKEEFQGIQEEMQGIPYKAAVGSLMYVMVGTRPDLAFPVSMVSQFMSRAGPSHWMAVKCIMRYLKGTLDLKLCLEARMLVWGDIVMPIGVEMQMNSVPPRVTCSLLEWESCHGIARGNLQLPCLPWRPNAWPLVNAPRRPYGWGSWWQMWDLCKMDQQASCVIIKDALHLQRTLPTTLTQSTLTYNTTSFKRSWRVEK